MREENDRKYVHVPQAVLQVIQKMSKFSARLWINGNEFRKKQTWSTAVHGTFL